MHQAKQQRRNKEMQALHTKSRLTCNTQLRSHGSYMVKKEDVSLSSSSGSDSFEYDSPTPLHRTTIRIKPNVKTVHIISPTTASQADDESSDKHSPHNIKTHQYIPKSILKRPSQPESATPTTKFTRRQGLRSSPTATIHLSTPPNPIRPPTIPPCNPTKKVPTLKRPLEHFPETPNAPLSKKPRLSAWKKLVDQKKQNTINNNVYNIHPSRFTDKLLSLPTPNKKSKHRSPTTNPELRAAALLEANTKANERIPSSPPSSPSPSRTRRSPKIAPAKSQFHSTPPSKANVKLNANTTSKGKRKRLSELEKLLRDVEAMGLLQ